LSDAIWWLRNGVVTVWLAPDETELETACS
jgi:hypothetical protein